MRVQEGNRSRWLLPLSRRRRQYLGRHLSSFWMALLHKDIAAALQKALPPSTARLQPALVRDIWAVALWLKYDLFRL